ncbi:MAG TPA: AMP-binding protein [Beijerinckiaceae bacterium]|jgi:long-chain acyl-CoA synthetase
MTIGATLDAHARRRPAATALICDERRLTWRELAEAVAGVERDLDSRAPPAAGVALLLSDPARLLVTFLAAARTGREAQVLDASWPPRLRDEVLAALRPAAVYADHEPPPPPAAPVARPAPAPEAPFYVGFTSGSTGAPKGYRRNHRSWIASFEADAQEFGIGPQDVVLAPGSLTHSLFLYAAVHAVHVGATLILARRFRPDAALARAREDGATVLYGAPTQLRLLLDVADAPLTGMRWVLSSGAKWFAEAGEALRRRFPAARFAEFYGASELSYVTVRKADEPCPETSVGRPFAGVRVTIRDEAGREAPPGRVGRVFVESPFLFDGYVMGGGRLARCGAAMSVGDLGRLDADGFLHLVGREARMIVTSGKNVYPEEVERALESHPAVAAAAVFGVPDPRRGERLVAMVLPEGDATPRRRDLSRHLRDRLPTPLTPRILVRPSAWRWTRSGKTDYAALRADWDAGRWEMLP